ncbi:MAG: IS1595 family transposase [Betaproteobacteria bacterium]|nr:IS1595 family transposase [Betaproteobacteria bacterium]
MKTHLFKALSDSVAELSRSQIDKLAKLLDVRRNELDSMRALVTHEPKACPHCGSLGIVRNGIQNGLQRFRCKDCHRTCSSATGTPLARLKRKDLLAGYAQCLREGLTLRQTAERLDISLDRAFRWRHRFLARPVEHQPGLITGLLEIDETYFQRSEKGSRALTREARGHGGMTSGSGRLAEEWVPVLVGRARGKPYVLDKVLPNMTKAEVAKALKPSVDPKETMLCSDTHKTFLSMEKELGVACQFFVESEEHKAEGLHVNNVNNYHQRLKTWVNCVLRGVATKYLPHYLAWQRLRTWSVKPLDASDYIGSALGRKLINV